MKLMHWLKQIFPLTYRQQYVTTTGEHHFAVWKMWLGRIYNVHDFVILHNFDLERRCQQAIAGRDYRGAARFLLALEEDHNQRIARIRNQYGGGLQGSPADQRSLHKLSDACCTDPTGETHADKDGAYIISQQAYMRLVGGAQSTILPGQFFVPTGEEVRFQTYEDGCMFCAVATRVAYKKLSEVTEDEAADAGYYDADICRAALRGEGCNEAVTIINLEQIDI